MTPHDEAHIAALSDIARCLLRRPYPLVFHVGKALEGVEKDSPVAVHLQKARQIAKDIDEKSWQQFRRLHIVIGDIMSARIIRDRRRRIMRTLRSGHDFTDGELRWPHQEEE